MAVFDALECLHFGFVVGATHLDEAGQNGRQEEFLNCHLFFKCHVANFHSDS